jgi:hypothetical protein
MLASTAHIVPDDRDSTVDVGIHPSAGIGLSSPHEAAVFDGTYTASLCAVAAAAALAASGAVRTRSHR